MLSSGVGAKAKAWCRRGRYAESKSLFFLLLRVYRVAVQTGIVSSYFPSVPSVASRIDRRDTLVLQSTADPSQVGLHSNCPQWTVSLWKSRSESGKGARAAARSTITPRESLDPRFLAPPSACSFAWKDRRGRPAMDLDDL